MLSHSFTFSSLVSASPMIKGTHCAENIKWEKDGENENKMY